MAWIFVGVMAFMVVSLIGLQIITVNAIRGLENEIKSNRRN